MATRKTRYDDFIGMPVEKDLKKRVKRVALVEERSPTEMARILLREGVERHEEKHGKPELAASAKD